MKYTRQFINVLIPPNTISMFSLQSIIYLFIFFFLIYTSKHRTDNLWIHFWWLKHKSPWPTAWFIVKMHSRCIKMTMLNRWSIDMKLANWISVVMCTSSVILHKQLKVIQPNSKCLVTVMWLSYKKQKKKKKKSWIVWWNVHFKAVDVIEALKPW